ncbi:MAG: hypothetical protein AB8B56_09610 [Crocinitomicaceae bacterium]
MSEKNTIKMIYGSSGYPLQMKVDIGFTNDVWDLATWTLNIQLKFDSSNPDYRLLKVGPIPPYPITVILDNVIKAQGMTPEEFWIPGEYDVVLIAEPSSPSTLPLEGVQTTFRVEI